MTSAAANVTSVPSVYIFGLHETECIIIDSFLYFV